MKNQPEDNEAELRAKIAQLQATVEDLSDHGCAAERMERLKAQSAEIDQLKAEYLKLDDAYEKALGKIEQHGFLLSRAAETIESFKPNPSDKPKSLWQAQVSSWWLEADKLIAELRKAAE